MDCVLRYRGKNLTPSEVQFITSLTLNPSESI